MRHDPLFIVASRIARSPRAGLFAPPTVGLWLALLVGGLGSLGARAEAAPGKRGGKSALAVPAAEAGAVCAGEYGDELSVVVPRVREFERDPQNQYSYCLRTTAVYECLSYASDGSVRRVRKTVVAHGTGFAYRRSGGETFVLTNEHVASWPSVTGEEHAVEDVPTGCKLVSDSLKIVDDEADDYEGNDVPLTRVVTDPTLDVAVAKTRAPLKTIPYRVGRSASLHVGNAVAVHGFPLGAFAATNHGKVVNAYDHDTDKDWDHMDFVVDALLSPGNSGSPVMAVSCRTGEYELVGIYHAGYVRGSALNVVIGIDQVKDMMSTLKRSPRVSDTARASLGPDDRRAVMAQLAAPGHSPFFPFGALVATARREGEAIVFEVYSRGFPLKEERLLVIEDLPEAPVAGAGASVGAGASDGEATTGSATATSGFGERGRVYIGNGRGLRGWPREALDGEAQAQLDRIVTRLRAGAVSTARFREVDATTSKGHKRRRQVERAMERQEEADKDAAQSLADLSERLGPHAGEKALAYEAAVAPLRTAAAATGNGKPAASAAAPLADTASAEEEGILLR